MVEMATVQQEGQFALMASAQPLHSGNVAGTVKKTQRFRKEDTKVDLVGFPK